MKNIHIDTVDKKYSISIPESWNEVPAHLYTSIARLYLRQAKHMNVYDKMVRTLAVLAEENTAGLKSLSNHQLLDLCKLVLPLLEKLDLTDNPSPSFVHKSIEYFAPKFDFSNLRFGEFVMTETYFKQYIDSEREHSEVLDKLIAVLYRNAGKGEEYVPGTATYRGDKRVKFNSNVVEHYAQLFRDLDLALKDGIVLWYAAAREQFFSCYRELFSRKSQTKNSHDTSIDWGWFGVYDDLLGEKGRTAESLEDEFVSSTLMSLERAKINANELKKKK